MDKKKIMAILVIVAIVSTSLLIVYNDTSQEEKSLTGTYVDAEGNPITPPLSFLIGGGIAASGVYATVNWAIDEVLSEDYVPETFEIEGTVDLYELMLVDGVMTEVLIDSDYFGIWLSTPDSYRSKTWMFADYFIPDDLQVDQSWQVRIHATLDSQIDDIFGNTLFDDWATSYSEAFGFLLTWKFDTGTFGIIASIEGVTEE